MAEMTSAKGPLCVLRDLREDVERRAEHTTLLLTTDEDHEPCKAVVLTYDELMWALSRIEREVRQAMEDQANEIHGQYAEGWVELPRDADGVPIRIGDVVDFSKGVTNHAVLGVGIGVDGVCDEGVFVRVGYDYEWCNAMFLRHHEPCVEDVLREFSEKYCDVVSGEDEEKQLFAEYTAKLRLAGDES